MKGPISIIGMWIGIYNKNKRSFKFERSQRSYGQTGRRTVGQTDMARSTWLVILIKNIYHLWGRNRFLLHVTYFRRI